MFRMIQLFLLVLCLLPVSSATAHQLRPTIVDVQFRPDASFELKIQLNLEAVIAGIGPKHADTEDAPQAVVYNDLRSLPPEELETKFNEFESRFRAGLGLGYGERQAELVLDSVRIPAIGDLRQSRLSYVVYTGNTPPGVSSVQWQYNADFGNCVVRFGIAGDENKVSHWLTNGSASPPFPLSEEVVPKSRGEVAFDYLVLGFEHIVPKGLDHILFVLGLFLLSSHWRPLLWQVTSFTLAHTLTLGLSIYGLISLSPAVIEPLIALSIAYVGIENLLTRRLHASRIIIVFLFGLLHGMGFASILFELGLPSSEFLTALVTFNIGVEFGQLSVILGAFLLISPLRLDAAAYRRFIVVPGSLLIALTGLYWTWQRLLV